MPDMGILKFNMGTFKLVNAQQSKHRSKGFLNLGINASEEASKREVTLRNEQLMARVLETPETAILCTIQAQECSAHFLIYCFFLFFPVCTEHGRRMETLFLLSFKQRTDQVLFFSLDLSDLNFIRHHENWSEGLLLIVPHMTAGRAGF